jgi:alcohol dehydrogenase (cytochrome c)
MLLRIVAATASLTCLVFGQTPPTDSGQAIFEKRCAMCHGADGRGGERGPDIVTSDEAPASEADLRATLRKGVPTGGMPAFTFPEPQMKSLVRYVLELAATGGSPALRSEPAAPVSPLPFEKLLSPEPGDWPSYHGQLSGNRHSSLNQINTSNVAKLGPKWMFQIPDSGRLEVTPVVVNGVMYVTTVNAAFALDAHTGQQLWRYRRSRSKGLAGDAAGGINRGVAVLEDKVFLVTDNAHLLALDRATGKLVWETTMADSSQNYGSTSAPLIVKDLVISGVSGGDEGVRGFLSAYKVSNGERVWRFWTIPAPGEPLSETWKGHGGLHGCGTTWLTGTYDPEENLLYWPTGNPCPDYNGDVRRGDNLYSSSVVALDPATGKLRWYYQYTPHDVHDWDGVQTPMLVDADFQGSQRHLLLQASRNGFFYVLDRSNGKVLLAKPFVSKLTWASEIGPDGRPKMLPGADPTPEGTKACPAVEGASNWMSTAFDAATDLFYLEALEKCNIYVKSPPVWEAGKSYYGGSTRDVPGEPGQKFLRALDIQTGKIVWEHPQKGPATTWGGVLLTDGGLVFYGDDGGSFAAVDAKSGTQLWEFRAHAFWKASPMTYMAGGAQYVAVAAGGVILAFGL